MPADARFFELSVDEVPLPIATLPTPPPEASPPPPRASLVADDEVAPTSGHVMTPLPLVMVAPDVAFETQTIAAMPITPTRDEERREEEVDDASTRLVRAPRTIPHWKLAMAFVLLVLGGELGYAYGRFLPSDAREARSLVRAAVAREPVAHAPIAEDVATTTRSSPPIPALPPPATPESKPLPAHPEIPPTMGRLVTTDAPKGRRIYVDQKIVAETPRSVLVKCGTATVKIGSAGQAHVVDIPCGDEIHVGD